MKEVSDKKRLLENFFSLSVLQAATYILPLLTVPYLVRVLGPERFGLIAFAQAFLQYFVLMTDYGFNLSATREISIHRNDAERVASIFTGVMLIKAAFTLAGFAVLCCLVFSIERFRAEWVVYLFSFGAVIGNLLFPVWLFQGRERMKEVAALNILARVISVVLIFVFIRTGEDYIYTPLINSAGGIVAGLVSLRLACSKLGVGFGRPSPAEIKKQLAEGRHIFFSTIAINLYTTSNTFILGVFTNNTIVGYYSGGEKIIRAVQGLMNPLIQTLYPYISKLASESKEKAVVFILRTGRRVGAAAFIVSLFLFALAEPISNIILGAQFRESINVIRIMSFLPFIIGLSTIFAYFFLLAFGYTKTLSRIIGFSALVSVLGAVVFVYLFDMKHIGISINIVITEILVFVLSFLAYKDKVAEING